MNIQYFISAATLTFLTCVSAHAIDPSYRKLLERSGCTQMSEAQGCDINKTKAENAKAGFGASSAVKTAPADAKVKGTPYHATGKVPCSMGDAPAGSAQCDFGVVRGKAGNAEVVVTPPGGFKRILKFTVGSVTTAEAKITATKLEDNWLIDVNDYEHYIVPMAVIEGG